MRSSYSVIKKDNLKSGEQKVITTSYTSVSRASFSEDGSGADNRDDIMQSFNSIGENIVKNARRERDNILYKVMEEAKTIEKEAYEKGYAQGESNGYEDGHEKGYREAYDGTIVKAQEEANRLISEANEVLLKSNDVYTKYLEDKKKEIVNLAINIAESVLKRELGKENGIDELVQEYIEASKGNKVFLIKCNKKHSESIKAHVQEWKSYYGIEEIHLIEDESIPEGNAEIHKDNGKSIVGIDIGMEKIRDALIG